MVDGGAAFLPVPQCGATDTPLFTARKYITNVPVREIPIEMTVFIFKNMGGSYIKAATFAKDFPSGQKPVFSEPDSRIF